MSAKWFGCYKDFFYKTRFISQLSAFLVSLFSLLSFYDLLWSGYYNPLYVEANKKVFLFSIAFHIFLFLIFAIRFTLLWFSSNKSFLLAQFLWLIGLTGLLIYSFSMSEPKIGHHQTEYFLLISSSLFSLISLYIVLSPIRQLTVLMISYFNSDELNSKSG